MLQTAVEVEGFEPSSFGLFTGLLRAQPAMRSWAVAFRRHTAITPVN